MNGRGWMGWLMAGIFLFAPLAGMAAERRQAAYQLDAVVVSATRSEMPVFDAPKSVTVIGADEIMASPFERVEDIVRSVPGLYNFRHYGLQANGIASPLKMRDGVNSSLRVASMRSPVSASPRRSPVLSLERSMISPLWVRPYLSMERWTSR